MQCSLLLVVLVLATCPLQALAADPAIDVSKPDKQAATDPKPARRFLNLRGLPALASAVATGAQQQNLRVQQWHPSPGDLDRQLLFRWVLVNPNGTVVIDGLSFPEGKKRLLSGITGLLEALKSSNLGAVRLQRLTWEPYREQTVAAFQVTAALIPLSADSTVR
jgi:hypothetical protein